MTDYIKYCCGKKPVIWEYTCNTKSFCGCDVEKIECDVCHRVIYGVDEFSIIKWNEGGNDMTDYEKLKKCFDEIGIKYEIFPGVSKDITDRNYWYIEVDEDYQFHFDEYGKYIK